jgi:DNA-binding response OmpR family regulator
MARILVIDDENNIRMMMKLALQHMGHTVGTAADGQDGLDMYRIGDDWDLVILDQRMPGLEGLEVLLQIRVLNPRAKVIMATAFGTVDLAVDAMKAGATDFLRKPFTADILRGAVDGALKGAMNGRQEKDAHEASTGLTFGMTTINGYRIEFHPGASVKIKDGIGFEFTVRRPDGESRKCTVTLSAVLMELVKAELDCEQPAAGNRFWQALCEETLANYVYQNADFPPENVVRVDDLTAGLRRYIHAITAPASS